MTIASEIQRIGVNISNAYDACESKGATLPTSKTSANLASTISAIPAGTTPTLASLTVTPSTTAQTITPPSGTDGYNTVIASAVTASIDNNITAGNIKDGVSILGVTGTLQAGGTTPTGTYTITANGTYDVTDYASADVSVSGGGGTTYSYPKLKGGNWYVLNDETVVPMSFKSVTFNGGSYSNVSVFATYQGISLGQYDTTDRVWHISSPVTTAAIKDVDLTNAEALGGKTIKHISIGFPQSNVTNVKIQNYAFQSISTLQSVSISNMNNLVLTGTFKGCTNLSEVDVSSIDSMPLSGALSGTASNGGAFSGCTSLQTLSFNSLKSTSFGSYTNQFNFMLRGVTGCTVHFPSNLQSVIGSWASVTSGFSGTNTTVVFDLPATT